MDLKRLITRFTYRIEPKPEGGFIAHPSDPTVPPLEAPTREELQQKIQANVVAGLAAEFPALKLPIENNKLKSAYYVERNPGGPGSIFRTTDGKGPVMIGATRAEIEGHLAERVGWLVGKLLVPGMSQALADQLDPEDSGSFARNKVKLSPVFVDANTIQAQRAQNTGGVNFADSSPITPEKGNGVTVLRYVLTLAAIAALLYFFLHR